MAQEILIEFITDYSSLDKAIDVLERTGQVDQKVANSFKATNAEIVKQGQAIKNTGNAFRGPIQSIDQLDKRTKKFVQDFIEGFQEGINEELARAKPELDALRKKIEQLDKGGVQAFGSLKKELRSLTEQIAQAKASGGPIDPAMLKRAGELKDAIADANAEIKNSGSDTRNIDNVVGSISALAGGYSAVQGAAALFGDENEDLNKSLLKVNATMAIATGIQQFANAIQKEGSIAKLADVIATNAQIATQKIYTLVTGKATAATTAFKVALAATGIGLFVVGLLAVVSALSDVEDKIDDNIDALKRLDEAEREGSLRFIDDAERRELAVAKTEAEQLAIQQKFSRLRIQTLKRTNADANDIRDEETDMFVREEEFKKKEREKGDADAKKAAEERLKRERELRAAGFEDFKAGIELQLLQVEKGSQEELALRKKLLNAELLIALEGEKLTNNQRKLLLQQYFKERTDLEAQFNKEVVAQAAANEQARLQGELTRLNISGEEKLALNLSLLEVMAAQEVEAANGNAAKIRAINLKLAADIREAKRASLEKEVEDELAIRSASEGAQIRALERLANSERATADQRINAVNQLAEKEAEAVQKRIDLNQELYNKNLISHDEFNKNSAQLIDQQSKVWEDAEVKRGDITEKENERIRESMINLAQDFIEVFGQAVDVLDSIFAGQAAKENAALEDQKRKLKELEESGAITEKEALTRQKRLEAEERKIKQRQAQRDKQVAVFNALLAIPSAILRGLQQGGPVLAAIYGGLAAVQAGLVIARPVPKFAKGKKNNYEGPGIMGEAGAELIQRADGSMHVATKPTLVYVGAKDKIFTHSETKNMLPNVDRALMRRKELQTIDHDKLAEAIARNIKPGGNVSVNIDKEFISESVANGLLKNNYFDRYYKFK